MTTLARPVSHFADEGRRLEYAVFKDSEGMLEGIRFEIRIQNGDLVVTPTKERDMIGLDRPFWLNVIRESLVKEINEYGCVDSLDIPGSPGCHPEVIFL